MDLSQLKTGPSAPQLAAEAGIVAVVVMILYMVLHFIIMQVDDKFAMSHLGMAVAAFLTGLSGHLLFEATGLNDKFINYRL
jgi:hypothetical protein